MTRVSLLQLPSIFWHRLSFGTNYISPSSL